MNQCRLIEKTVILLLMCSTGVFFNMPVIAEEEEILYWVAPMDPNYRRDKPGKSPMGMDLVPVYADGGEATVVSIKPEVVQNLGIRTTRAERTRLWRGIDTVGYVDYDESRVSHIHLRTEGWIENLAVKSEGERVKQGDRLFDLYSPELVNAQQEFVTALSSGNKRLIRASRARLAALGVSDGQVSNIEKTRETRQHISVYAPQDGVVSVLKVREGMFVKPASNVMSLGDLSTVWLLAEIFERQALWVSVGQQAEVRLSYVPGKVWQGTVEYIYPSLDPKTRTLKVRMRFENADEGLKPNMYANVKIFGGAKEGIVVIPIEGLIRTGRDERVVVSLGEGRFEARDVTAGIESGDYVEIIEGVEEGEDIVVSGQFLIDSEASMRASIKRMDPVDGDAGESAMETRP
ncbi:MAG: efflux RND transporter periplasmic adaptor subunit [Thiotrichales bacterium]|nr:MAG: efflux RND transporter periplasmic adaptor subunit [Thiotrichales bacterium]